ncbi:RNA-binding protein [Candidatus Bathyarchaeota archaeon]|nr:RNA-binding protein [Candidatus Bathyarchaeota archaeon]
MRISWDDEVAIYTQRRQLVTPGELLAQGEYYPELNTFKEKDKIYSMIVGLFDYRGNRLSVVPLKHCYIPYVGDLVIGKVVDSGMSGWTVDIHSPYSALLPLTEATSRPPSIRKEVEGILRIGDLIKAKVIAFDRTKDPILTIRDRDLGRVTRGKVVKISPSKIPRLIGKKGSMINLLKKESLCDLTVGQNGVILVMCKSPEAEEAVIDVIKMIEREAHTQGLTDRVSEALRRRIGSTP